MKLKLQKPKRSDYGRDREGRSNYRDMCQLTALAQLALDHGATLVELEALVAKNPTDFIQEPVLVAVEELRLRLEAERLERSFDDDGP